MLLSPSGNILLEPRAWSSSLEEVVFAKYKAHPGSDNQWTWFAFIVTCGLKKKTFYVDINKLRANKVLPSNLIHPVVLVFWKVGSSCYEQMIFSLISYFRWLSKRNCGNFCFSWKTRPGLNCAEVQGKDDMIMVLDGAGWYMMGQYGLILFSTWCYWIIIDRYWLIHDST